MRFAWSDERLQLQDMVRRLVAEQFDFEARQARVASGDGGATWAALAELGLTALPFDEAVGGIGGGMLDVVLVMEAFGRGLIVEPYIPSVIVAGGLLRRAVQNADITTLLGRIAAGDLRMAFAYAEPGNRHAPRPSTCRATSAPNGWTIDGSKAMVLGGDEAESLIVSCRIAGDDTVGLFLVPADAPGLGLRRIRNIDGTGAAEIAFEGTPADRLDIDRDAGALIDAVLDEAAVAACAEMVGAMAAMNEKTTAYLLDRKAFGQEIAKFQAIQHRLVDMRVAQEQATAMMLKAAEALDLGRADAPRAVAAAKHLVGEEARRVAKAAVQLHGAIGVTEELDISHYFRRIYALSTEYGDAAFHLRRYAALNARAEAA